MKWLKFSPVAFLVVVTTVALFGMTALLMFVPMPKENADTIKSLLSQITVAWVGSIVAFYFGSSVGSAERRQAEIQKNSDAVTKQVELKKTTTTSSGGEPPKVE